MEIKWDTLLKKLRNETFSLYDFDVNEEIFEDHINGLYSYAGDYGWHDYYDSDDFVNYFSYKKWQKEWDKLKDKDDAKEYFYTFNKDKTMDKIHIKQLIKDYFEEDLDKKQREQYITKLNSKLENHKLKR